MQATDPLTSGFSIYPNPTSEKLTIAYKEGSLKENTKIQLYNNRGIEVGSFVLNNQVCASGKGKLCKCAGSKEMDVSFLSPGLYYLLIEERGLVRKEHRFIMK